MDFKIVIIDDNLTEKEPFVQNIRMHYKDADYNHVFQNPDKGLEYVLENLLYNIFSSLRYRELKVQPVKRFLCQCYLPL